MIEVRELSKSFESKGRLRARERIKAVDRVSFVATDRAITGLLGPNGAGKTTLLRMLATLLAPESGNATIDGCDVCRDRSAVRRRIGVLSDARGIYPRLTAMENIRYYAALQGMPAALAHERARALIDQLGMTELAERRCDGFSQGERTKVAIARILVHDPHTVLLDEPTNGLDVIATRAMREIVRGLRASGKCVLFSSHIMQEVAALCDRIVILVQGRVAAQGTSAELLAQTQQLTLEEAFVRILGAEVEHLQ